MCPSVVVATAPPGSVTRARRRRARRVACGESRKKKGLPQRVVAAPDAAVPHPPAPLPPPPSPDWAWLPEGPLSSILDALPPHSRTAARCVCRHWRNAVDGGVTALAPAEPRLRTLARRFPALRALDVRDARTSAIGYLSPRLACLAIGGSRLSNGVTAAVGARLAGSLTSLRISSETLTGERCVAPLTALAGLRALDLDCRRLSDKAVAGLVSALPRLEALATSAAVGDATLGALNCCSGRLTSLRLALPRRVTGGALAALAASPGGSVIRVLSLSSTTIHPAALAGFSNLTTLALPYSPAVTSASLSSLHHLHLTALDVRHCTGFDDASLRRSVWAWGGGLTALRLEGARASAAAVTLALSSLTRLRSLSLDASRLKRCGVALGKSTWCGGGLTRLVVRGVETPAQTWAGLAAAFPALIHLTIIEREAWSPAAPVPFPVGTLTGLTALESLELNAGCVGGAAAALLLSSLPRLATVIVSNALSHAGLGELAAALPGVDVRKARPRTPGGWVDAMGSVW